MIINIESEVEIDESMLADIQRALELAGEIYGVENSEVSVTLTNDQKIHELNLQYRGIDRPTDVLSFAFRDSDEPEIFSDADSDQPEILGDIIISIDRAKSQAEEFGHSIRREIVFLTVHGILHLLGYDHMEETDRLEMESEQKFMMERLGISREE
ncbi:MAG: rRNA maturation RNase YbeY [Selenomonadaceae bacterium]|nr:rRNA maturation RNase YbeY [Selenomonadaceae bacterium]